MPHFDKWQFRSHRRAISAHWRPAYARQDSNKIADEGWASPGIDYSNLRHQGGNVRLEKRDSNNWRRTGVPEWAENNTLLQETILKLCERRLFLRPDPSLNHAQRLERIRTEELRRAKEQWEPVYERLRERYKTMAPGLKRDRLEVQMGNVSTQIMICRRGNAAVTSMIAYLSYRLGYHSVQVAEQMKLKPAVIRQTLARLNHAADNVIYRSPKYRAISRARRQLVLAGREKVAYRFKVVPERQGIKKWTFSLLLFVHAQRAQGRHWSEIAPILGIKRWQSLQTAYRYWKLNLHLLPDFTGAEKLPS